MDLTKREFRISGLRTLYSKGYEQEMHRRVEMPVLERRAEPPGARDTNHNKILLHSCPVGKN